MKKIIIALVFIAGLITSCNDDFLEVAPREQLSDATFWKTEQHVYLATVGVYDNWGWASDDGAHNVPARAVYLGEAWSDNGATSNFWDGFWYNLWAGNVSPEDGTLNNYWKSLYETIRKANVVLANIDKPDMDEAARKRYSAEMKFIRAYEYHILLANWGGVPLVDKPLELDELDIPKATAEATLDFIVKDLTEAILDLPATPLESGRITKGAAIGLKARVLLYGERWNEAASTAKDLMDLGIHDLFQTAVGDGYQKQFTTEGNTEVLASWKYNEEKRPNEKPGLLTWWQWWAAGNLLSPTQALVDAYDAYDNTSDELITVDPANQFANRDPRLAYTVVAAGSSTGYGINKFISGNTATENILIRYAEVLLTYAEGKVESNDIDQSVLDAINQVRARAYGVDINDTSGYPEIITTNQSELRDIVRNERRIELAMEGLRWYDITRWRIAEVVMNGNVVAPDGSISKTRTWSSKDYLRPIPQAQIDLSAGILKQNDGYN